MKSAKQQSAKSAAKLTTPKSVEEYCGRIPDSARAHFDKLRATVRASVPADAVEVISYAIPAFKRQRILIWFAAFANHCSLFPTARIIENFRDQLGGFTISKGTIQFPLDKPLPTALIRKIIKARVAQDDARKPA